MGIRVHKTKGSTVASRECGNREESGKYHSDLRLRGKKPKATMLFGFYTPKGPST